MRDELDARIVDLAGPFDVFGVDLLEEGVLEAVCVRVSVAIPVVENCEVGLR